MYHLLPKDIANVGFHSEISVQERCFYLLVLIIARYMDHAKALDIVL